MGDLLRENEDPPFRIRKKTIKKGTILDHYIPEEGRIVKVRFDEDFPIVVLEEGRKVWMSDSPFELEAVKEAVEEAHGEVLTSGLGLGVFTCLAGAKPKVDSIDVVEKEEKVINLVGPALKELPILGKKIRIINEDLYHFLRTVSKAYDFIFLDIWGDILGPVKEVDQAVEAAQRCLKPGGRVMVWLQELIDRIKEKLPKEPVLPGEARIQEPCLVCGKTLRNDYAGLCMDCADGLGVSEIFLRR